MGSAKPGDRSKASKPIIHTPFHLQPLPITTMILKHWKEREPNPTRVLLSIHPEYANAILSGEKRIEFRKKKWAATSVHTVLLYATEPVGMVIGEFTIVTWASGTAEDMWRAWDVEGCISKDKFFEYFRGSKTAYGILIGSVTRYAEPKTTQDLFGIKAPQSFCYLP